MLDINITDEQVVVANNAKQSITALNVRVKPFIASGFFSNHEKEDIFGVLSHLDKFFDNVLEAYCSEHGSSSWLASTHLIDVRNSASLRAMCDINRNRDILDFMHFIGLGADPTNRNHTNRTLAIAMNNAASHIVKGHNYDQIDEVYKMFYEDTRLNYSMTDNEIADFSAIYQRAKDQKISIDGLDYSDIENVTSTYIDYAAAYRTMRQALYHWWLLRWSEEGVIMDPISSVDADLLHIETSTYQDMAP